MLIYQLSKPFPAEALPPKYHNNDRDVSGYREERGLIPVATVKMGYRYPEGIISVLSREKDREVDGGADFRDFSRIEFPQYHLFSELGDGQVLNSHNLISSLYLADIIILDSNLLFAVQWDTSWQAPLFGFLFRRMFEETALLLSHLGERKSHAALRFEKKLVTQGPFSPWGHEPY